MKKNTATNEFTEPARHLVEDLRELLDVTAHVARKKAAAARKYLTPAKWMGKGRDVWHTIQARAVSAAKAAGRVIREHPYPSVGLALGLGLVLGFLMRGTRMID